MTLQCFGTSLLLSAFAFSSLSAQTITGQVDDADGQPISMALLTLLDESESSVRTALTTAGGEFSLDAGRAGTFRLRVERIGMATHTTPPFDVATGEVLNLPIEVSVAAIQLEGLRVETTSRCLVRPEDGGSIATLWEEAQKSLAITAAVEERRVVRLTGVHYVRELEGRGLRQSAVHLYRSFSSSGPLFDAVPGTTLMRDGFARVESDGSLIYHAPSASVMLSVPFLDAHCFNRVIQDRNAPGLVGLGFEPVPGSTRVGIAGTMWLDVASGEIRSVEYDYRDPDGQMPDGGNGRVELTRLPSGALIVSQWWIRMPSELVLPRLGPRGVLLPMEVAAWHEEGGFVLDADGEPLGLADELLAQLDAVIPPDDPARAAAPRAEPGPEDPAGAGTPVDPARPAEDDAALDALDSVLADLMARSTLSAETLVQGRVQDAMTGTGVAGAFVVLLQEGARYSAQTGEDGGFTFAGIESGPYEVNVRHLAFPTVVDSVEVGGGGRVTRVDVRLHRDVVELSPIVATVDRRPTFGVLAPLYDRIEFQRSLGMGRIWERDEIEASGATLVEDLLRTVPGVSVVQGRPILNMLTPMCSSPLDPRVAPQPPSLYIDGARINSARFFNDREPDEIVRLDHLVPLAQVEVIEVYRRGSEIPGEFGGSDAQCGVIAVWTRRGR